MKQKVIRSQRQINNYLYSIRLIFFQSIYSINLYQKYEYPCFLLNKLIYSIMITLSSINKLQKVQKSLKIYSLFLSLGCEIVPGRNQQGDISQFFYKKVKERQAYYNYYFYIYQMIATLSHKISSPTKSDPDTQTDDQVAINAKQRNNKYQYRDQCHSKIKSSLCRNFARNGCCPYGDKCQFAHGPQELRINEHINTSYKTKPCFTFLKQGYCCYGETCNFLHAEDKKIEKSKFSKIVSNFPEMIQIVGGTQSRLINKLYNNQRP